MKIHKNIGGVDRLIRIVVLVVFIYLGYVVSAWFYLLAVLELFVIVARWCPVYDLLKWDSLGGKK
jgi:hypothetical protein